MKTLDDLREMVKGFPDSFGLLRAAILKQIDAVEEEIRDTSITWSVDDFIMRARVLASMGTIHEDDDAWEGWKEIYDEEEFENALYEMIAAHDANYGITWDSIDAYLQMNCKK